MRLAVVIVGAAMALAATGDARAAEYAYVRAGEPAHFVCGAASAGWNRPEADDRAWDVGVPTPPDAGVPDGGAPACTATRFSRWRFDVGPELARLKTITLRIRYTHGYAAYLNGVEIARRRIDANAPPEALATDWHGPEYERVFVTVTPGFLRSSGNLLAVEVHPRAAGREPYLDVELTGSDGPRLVRGPYLLRVLEREATVAFDTDLPTVGTVEWGADESYGHVEREASPRKHHALALRGLAAGHVYHYRVTARDAVASNSALPRDALAQNSPPARVAARRGPIAARDATAQIHDAVASNSTADAEPATTAPAPAATAAVAVDPADAGDAQFHTPPASGKPLRFVVYGDVRSGHDVHAALDQQILQDDPDLILVTGDLVDRGTDEGDWERFFSVGAPLLRTLALFPAVGNHEYAMRGRGLAAYLAAFGGAPGDHPEEAYYSFDAAGVHFVALDSNQYGSPAQLSWLDRDLADAERRRARAIFVWAHHGPFSTGLHGDNTVAIHDYVPVCERHHVTIFFGGHDHDYERGRVGKLDYLVSGGGGAELRAPRCGVPGKRACPPHVAAFFNEHHYVLVEVLPGLVRVCPKRPDGSPLEACVTLPLAKEPR